MDGRTWYSITTLGADQDICQLAYIGEGTAIARCRPCCHWTFPGRHELADKALHMDKTTVQGASPEGPGEPSQPLMSPSNACRVGETPDCPTTLRVPDWSGARPPDQAVVSGRAGRRACSSRRRRLSRPRQPGRCHLRGGGLGIPANCHPRKERLDVEQERGSGGTPKNRVGRPDDLDRAMISPPVESRKQMSCPRRPAVG